MKRVEVILGADGSIKTEALGFKGASCLEATKFILDALGVEQDQDNTTIKSSFYEEEEALSRACPVGIVAKTLNI